MVSPRFLAIKVDIPDYIQMYQLKQRIHTISYILDVFVDKVLYNGDEMIIAYNVTDKKYAKSFHEIKKATHQIDESDFENEQNVRIVSSGAGDRS